MNSLLRRGLSKTSNLLVKLTQNQHQLLQYRSVALKSTLGNGPGLSNHCAIGNIGKSNFLAKSSLSKIPDGILNSQQRYYTTSKPPPPRQAQKEEVSATRDPTEEEDQQKSHSFDTRFRYNLFRFLQNNKKKFLGLAVLTGFILYLKEHPETYLGGYFNILLRFTRTMGTCLGIMINYKLIGMIDENSPTYKVESERIHQDSAEKILRLCLKNGGVYIKGGQYMASLNHILPQPYTKTLSILQDQVTWRLFCDIETVFIEDFGISPLKLFSDFDKVPIAAASLAQVHRAVTFEDKEVAVKIQYPDLLRSFDADMFTQRVLLKLINFVFPDFEFNFMADEMRTVLASELNFVQEANNGERAKREITHPNSYIPEVYRKYSSRRVITTEFIHGCRVTDIEKIHAMGLSEKDVAKNLIEICSEQIFIHGFVHVDPHPGNILVRVHPKKKGTPQIVLIDHGLYRELDQEFRLNFCHLYKALVLCQDQPIKHYSSILGVKNYKLFSSIVLMRNFENSSVGLSPKIATEELDKMRKIMMEKMKDINLLMRSMPKHLLLILRNNNLIRSINMELGSPVNRFTIMARYAKSGINSAMPNDNRYRITRFLSSAKETVAFELTLKGYEFYYWFIAKSVTFLVNIGILSPEKIMKKAMSTLG